MNVFFENISVHNKLLELGEEPNPSKQDEILNKIELC